MPQTWSLNIIRDFGGGAEPANVAGGGNLEAIFNAAADYWELAILDHHVITLHYSWAPLTGTSAEHFLMAQSGTPNRETDGEIFFDNDESSPIELYLDPTPYENEEFGSLREAVLDLGGGTFNVARYYYGASGQAVGRVDLLMVVMHEIAHALGMSLSNLSWQEDSRDQDIDVTAPRPFPGSQLPLATNINGVTTHFDLEKLPYGALLAGTNGDERRIPSAIDILANAQVSQFNHLNLDLAPVLQLNTAGESLTLSWSLLNKNFELQQSSNLLDPNSWVPVAADVVVSGGKYQVTIPRPATNLFFRLKNG